MIETGSEAPDFDLEVSGTERVRLADFRGRRNVLLVFHPFAFTPVCEEEARDLQENLPSFESSETDVVLVSCDSAPARQAWKEKLGSDVHAGLGLLATRPGGPGVRSLRRDPRRSRARHVPDRQGRNRRLEPRQRRRHTADRARLRLALDRDHLSLARYEWGDERLPALVCLHGVTSHGRHFEELAERLSDRFHVVALDLRGHGGSPWEPPWNLEQHVADVLDAAPPGPAAWLGHSFGGRIAYETTAAAPDRVERLVLLDPAILLPPQLGIAAAENARRDRSYVSFEEGIDRRYEESVLTTAPRDLVEGELAVHLLPDDDGRFRYRYCQSAVVAAYGEMTRTPPPFEQVRIPTLLVLGETSYIPYDHLLDAHAAALGGLLEVARISAGHTVLWDALDDTVGAVERFLS